jgi:hypothetical protein
MKSSKGGDHIGVPKLRRLKRELPGDRVNSVTNVPVLFHQRKALRQMTLWFVAPQAPVPSIANERKRTQPISHIVAKNINYKKGPGVTRILMYSRLLLQGEAHPVASVVTIGVVRYRHYPMAPFTKSHQ